MEFSAPVWERAMTIKDVIARGLSGEYNWWQAAEILEMSPRTLRRWQLRWQRWGIQGLLDRRRGGASKRREPRACFGEMLHLDGSPHRWLALGPEQQPTLVSVLDDGAFWLLYARLYETESARWCSYDARQHPADACR